MGAKLTVLPLAVVLPLCPVRSPPRWALNTFSAAVLPAVTGWLKVTATEPAAWAALALAAGPVLMMLSGGTVTVKATPLLVPPGVVTVTLPVVAPTGTVAVRLVAELNVTLVAAVPLKLTVLPLVKPVPASATLVPTGPLVGLKLVSVGATAVDS